MKHQASSSSTQILRSPLLVLQITASMTRASHRSVRCDRIPSDPAISKLNVHARSPPEPSGTRHSSRIEEDRRQANLRPRASWNPRTAAVIEQTGRPPRRRSEQQRSRSKKASTSNSPPRLPHATERTEDLSRQDRWRERLQARVQLQIAGVAEPRPDLSPVLAGPRDPDLGHGQIEDAYPERLASRQPPDRGAPTPPARHTAVRPFATGPKLERNQARQPRRLPRTALPPPASEPC